MIEQEIERFQQIYNLITEFLVSYSFQLLGAVVILGAGVYLAGKAGDLVFAFCRKHDVDVTLAKFLSRVIKVLLIVMVAIVALSQIGISVTPFAAAIGAASLGVGLALQGTLSNYGAGLSIILTRPFVVDDTIEVQGVSGVVKEVKLAATILANEEGEEITIPNRHIVGEVIHNSFANKLVEGSIGIGYEDDPEVAIRVVQQALAADGQIADSPAPQVGISEFADSAITIGFRYWVTTGSYHQKRYQANLRVFNGLKSAGLSIPFPRREVRLLGETGRA